MTDQKKVLFGTLIAIIVTVVCVMVTYQPYQRQDLEMELRSSCMQGVLPGPRLDNSLPFSRWQRKLSEIFDVPDNISRDLGPDKVLYPQKYLIYRCDNDVMKGCGGWADRVRAMLTAYLLANMTGRVFKAEILMPGCDLQKFMLPNRVDWNLPVSFHETIVPGDSVKVLDMWCKGGPLYTAFPRTDWVHHESMNSDYLYMKGNQDNMDNFKNYSFDTSDIRWMQKYHLSELNGFLFRHLFKPTLYLRNKVIRFLTEHVKEDKKLFCVHLRMGQNPTIPNDHWKGVSFSFNSLPTLWAYIEQHMKSLGNDTKMFLMSDSNEAIKLATKQTFAKKMFTSSGTIVHIEESKNLSEQARCDGFEKIIFEQLVLMQCDSLLITESGISRMAAFVRREGDLHCALTNGTVLPCTTREVKYQMFNTIN